MHNTWENKKKKGSLQKMRTIILKVKCSSLSHFLGGEVPTCHRRNIKLQGWRRSPLLQLHCYCGSSFFLPHQHWTQFWETPSMKKPDMQQGVHQLLGFKAGGSDSDSTRSSPVIAHLSSWQGLKSFRKKHSGAHLQSSAWEAEEDVSVWGHPGQQRVPGHLELHRETLHLINK